MRKLEDIIEEYERLRVNYREFTRSGNTTKNSLIEFQGRFVDLKADLRPILSKTVLEYEKRSDKQATAIKCRIAVAIKNGELKGEDGELLYDKCSMNQAVNYAASSDVYKTFLEQKSSWKESYINLRDLCEDIVIYINETKDRLKSL